MRIIVTGGRDYADDGTVERVLCEYLPGPHTLVHGGASGADQVAHHAARDLDWAVEVRRADWRRHGRAAGPIRNQAMADAGADLVLALPGGAGTADMVRRAQATGIPVRHITRYDKESA